MKDKSMKLSYTKEKDDKQLVLFHSIMSLSKN
jgi:hypothetical protein